MRVGKQKQGYTIVEVMIFLAVSGVMFIVAASFISGKQARSEFKQGMNDLNSQITQVINDVSNGYYPSSGNFVCQAGATGPPSLPGTGAARGQGEKQGCTFIGKVMQFKVSASPAGTYNIYTVVGRQFRSSADGSASAAYTPPSTFSEALPVVATDLTQTDKFKWGIQLDKMTDGSDIGAFGIFSGFSETNDGNDLASGAAAPIAIGITGSVLNQDAGTTQGQVANLGSPTATINTNPNIIMCFSGEAKQYGRLSIGNSGNGQRLTTSVQITTGAPSAGCA